MCSPGQSYGQPHTRLRGFGSPGIGWQTAILKVEEDSGVDSLAFTQDMHRQGAVPVGKKLQLIWAHWEINGDSHL